jgi:hypothetical protein
MPTAHHIIGFLRYFLNLRILHTYCGCWKISHTSFGRVSDMIYPWSYSKGDAKSQTYCSLPFLLARSAIHRCKALLLLLRSFAKDAQGFPSSPAVPRHTFERFWMYVFGSTHLAEGLVIPTHSLMLWERKYRITLKLSAVRKLRTRIRNK